MDPVRRARQLCLGEDTGFGCAEGTYSALQEHFGLEDADDSAAAMALNGGIAYSGATCGALTGAVLALGRVARERHPDRTTAKPVTRGIVQELMAGFETEFGSTDCRQLTGFDLAADHDAFLESGVWENGCMPQIEFVIDNVAPLLETGDWDATVARLGLASADAGPVDA